MRASLSAYSTAIGNHYAILHSTDMIQTGMGYRYTYLRYLTSARKPWPVSRTRRRILREFPTLYIPSIIEV